MRIPRLVLLSTLVSLLAGCPGRIPAPRSVPPRPGDALSRMKEQYACVNGVQGEAKIDSFSPKRGRIRGTAYLFAVNPDRVRFDVVSPFGASLYTLTSNGDLFQLLDFEKKELFEGPAKPCNLARLTQVPIPAHALVTLLRGEAPVLAHEPAGASMAWDAEEGHYRVVIEGRHGAKEEIHLEVHPDDLGKDWRRQRLRVKDVRVAQGGVDLYRAELRNHKVTETAPPREDPDGLDDPIPPTGGACSAEVPMSIRVTVPNTREDLIFQYKNAKWNPPLIAGTFVQAKPAGVEKIFADCER